MQKSVQNEEFSAKLVQCSGGNIFIAFVTVPAQAIAAVGAGVPLGTLGGRNNCV
jgi:hypothetical protein